MVQFSPFKGIQTFIDSILNLCIIIAVVVAIIILGMVISAVFATKAIAENPESLKALGSIAKTGMTNGMMGGLVNRYGLLNRFGSFD